MTTFKREDYVQFAVQTLDTLLIDAIMPIQKKKLKLKDLVKIEQNLCLQPCDPRNFELLVFALRNTLAFVIGSLKMDITGGVQESTRTRDGGQKTFKGGDYIESGLKALYKLLGDARVPPGAGRTMQIEDLEKIETDLCLQPCDPYDWELIIASLRCTMGLVISSLRADITGECQKNTSSPS